MKSSTWDSAFLTNLATGGVGNATYGYALQTGSNQLATLPWTGINTIVVAFNEPIGSLNKSSLILSGGSGGSTPTVTGFSWLGGNTYQWTLSTSLTNNQYEISFVGSGGDAVTDRRGAAIDGEFTTGSSIFPSGDGLAGGNFNFFFDVLPGDVDQSGLIDANDYNQVKSEFGQTPGGTYNPLFDVDGSGLINANDFNRVKSQFGASLPGQAPAPQGSQGDALQPNDDDASGANLSGVALAVQESTASQTGPTVAVSIVSNASSSSTLIERHRFGASNDRSTSAASAAVVQLIASTTQATDAVVGDFDLADLWA